MNELRKAGFIPFFKGERGIEFLFMVSSDANFGGDKPMISKGGVDGNETEIEAAIREAQEELGLKESNLKNRNFKEVWSQKTEGLTATYSMKIFIGEVKSKTDFSIPHYETEKTVWMTAEEFYRDGRQSHAIIVRAAAKNVL